MAKDNMRQIVNVLRRYPWIISSTFPVWRLLQPKFTLGAVGVILDNQQQVLLAEHAFHPKLPWGLPGGWVDRNEDPSQAIRRELREELSLDVIVGPVVLTDRPFPNHLDIAYLCQAKGPVGKLSFELLNYDWFNFERLPRVRKFNYRAIKAALSIAQKTDFEIWLQAQD